MLFEHIEHVQKHMLFEHIFARHQHVLLVRRGFEQFEQMFGGLNTCS